MDARTTNLLVLFPGALGDFVCLLPTLAALLQQFDGRITVAAKPSLLELLPDGVNRFSIDRREIADLFARTAPHDETVHLLSGFTHVHSWTGHGHAGFADRLHHISGAKVAVHVFRGMREAEHAVRYYARCAALEPRPWVFKPPSDAVAWATTVLQQDAMANALVIHPGSGSSAKNWTGFSALAARWLRHGRVIWILGPADETVEVPSAVDLIRNQPLADVGALLQRAPLYVGNDSGISHLAALAGTCGVALFGPSNPIVWRPLGLHLLRSGPPDACGDHNFCTHRLPVELVYGLLLSARATNAEQRVNSLR